MLYGSAQPIGQPALLKQCRVAINEIRGGKVVPTLVRKGYPVCEYTLVTDTGEFIVFRIRVSGFEDLMMNGANRPGIHRSLNVPTRSVLVRNIALTYLWPTDRIIHRLRWRNT